MGASFRAKKHAAHRLLGRLAQLNAVFGVSRMPLQLHCSPSRFCYGKSGFAVMYASLSFETCIVETLVPGGGKI